MHGAVGIAAEAAHLASREGHVGQAAKAVVSERENVMKSTASKRTNHTVKQRPILQVIIQIFHREKCTISLSHSLGFFGLIRRKSQLLARENEAKNRKLLNTR